MYRVLSPLCLPLANAHEEYFDILPANVNEFLRNDFTLSDNVVVVVQCRLWF